MTSVWERCIPILRQSNEAWQEAERLKAAAAKKVQESGDLLTRVLVEMTKAYPVELQPSVIGVVDEERIIGVEVQCADGQYAKYLLPEETTHDTPNKKTP